MGSVARLLLIAALGIAVMGCTASSRRQVNLSSLITMPVQEGWFAGRKVYYISTDISDPRMAQAAGMNLAPRLADAIPNYPKLPELKTVLERVYKFPLSEQDAIFASAPQPLGSASHDGQYSPLWLIYAVTWQPGQRVRELQSEEAVLTAEAQGAVEIVRSRIVVNCPIVGFRDTGEVLSGSQIVARRNH